MKLKGKTAIVTGGAQGIGKAIALAFAREGANLVLVDINEKGLDGTHREAEALGIQAHSIVTDVTESDAVRGMVEKVLKSFDRIDLLANVAGIQIRSPIEDLSEENWEKVMQVNVKGTFLCCQAVGRVMIQQNQGNIINMASVAGHVPQIYLGAYSPSKAAVLSLTQLMAMEWARYNIRVNSVSPGPIVTSMTADIYSTPESYQGRSQSIPMGRFGRPEEVARAFVFLASDDSSYMTGQTLNVDGGSLRSIFFLVDLLTHRVQREG